MQYSRRPDYLKVFEVQSWSLRKAEDSKLYVYSLLKLNNLVGYLILSRSDLMSHQAISELINSMMSAVDLMLGKRIEYACLEDLIRLMEPCNAILMTDQACNSELLLKIPKKLVLPDPNQLLLNPLKKKEVWVKLQYFT